MYYFPSAFCNHIGIEAKWIYRVARLRFSVSFLVYVYVAEIYDKATARMADQVHGSSGTAFVEAKWTVLFKVRSQKG